MYFWLLLVGLFGIVGSFVLLNYGIKRTGKNLFKKDLVFGDFKWVLIPSILVAFFNVAFIFGMLLYDCNPNLIDHLTSINKDYSFGWDVTPKEYFYIIFFGMLVGISASFLYVFYNLKNNKDILIKKRIRYFRTIEFISIAILVLSFCFVLEGIANNLYYPLVNGITINSSGLSLTRYNTQSSWYGNFSIKWYGIFIILGFLVAYFVSEKYFFRRYGQHGLMELMLIVVLVFGLIGARFWFCFVLEAGNYDFIGFLRVWEGGLAIEGGAMFGILFGGLYFVFFNKKVNVRNALEYVVPSILFGQIIGRIGNFLNHEVYGASVTRETFGYLPNLILNQMSTSFTGDFSNIFVPLFFIEMFVNLCGYFIIRYLIGEGLKQFRSLGDLACLYLSWYGLVRIIMEPLRNGEFMYIQSIITSWCMFGGGIVLLIALHLYDYFKYGKDDLIIYAISLLSKKPVYLKDKDLGPYKGKDSVFLHNGKKPKENLS